MVLVADGLIRAFGLDLGWTTGANGLRISIRRFEEAGSSLTYIKRVSLTFGKRSTESSFALLLR